MTDVQIVQTVDKSRLCAICGRDLEVNPASSTVTNLTASLLSVTRFLSLPTSSVTVYIPERKGLRVSTVLRILVLVGCKPMQAATAITKLCRANGSTIERSLNYLVQLGYVRALGKPRLIIPFQKYKVDTGYKITPKGEGVLARLLG